MLTSRPDGPLARLMAFLHKHGRSKHVMVGIVVVLVVAGLFTWLQNMPSRHSSAGGVAKGASTGSTTSTMTSAETDNPAQRAAGQPVPSAHKVIEQASLTIQLPQVKSAADQVSALAGTSNGFVESMQWSDSQNQSQVQMTVRVPEDRFASLVDAIRRMGTVSNFSQTGRDVTQQYNGLSEQLTQLRSEADAYTRLYTKAQSMQDMIQLQDALSKINSQIDATNVQLHDLNRAVELSAISLTLTSPSPTVVQVQKTSVGGAFVNSVYALGHFGMFVLTGLAWAVPWGLVAVAAWVMWHFWARRKKRSGV